MAVFAFVGFGELAASLADGLAASGRHQLRAYVRRPPPPGSPQHRRLARAGVEPCEQLKTAVRGAAAVLAAVPASAASQVAEDAAPLLESGALYVDLASAAPEAKARSAGRVCASGGSYVDAAVLGTVLTSGAAVPILASGPGASDFEALVASDGLKVTTIDAPAGHAALVKLIRGIYLKGRDALIVETMLTARRYGLAELVAASLNGPGERVPFERLAERILCSLAVHAERRADELAASSEVVARAGIDPSLARAGSRMLRNLARLGLCELFDGERPDDAEVVLAAIDERSGGVPGRSG